MKIQNYFHRDEVAATDVTLVWERTGAVTVVTNDDESNVITALSLPADQVRLLIAWLALNECFHTPPQTNRFDFDVVSSD